ncbi:hypothetical protein [Jannaschia pohangensis]|uniref:Uncharacterized protein n=1 Tax=Jannaschia pohangensis TaxID=390807 RepID=A0A1I3MEP6_9RHOB|nr:hypothetical protein [Jannaschia pohangensis]SFI95431.1 hypothetical protein SAMN04488095_1822 [Jannaschia pohangensis]
MRDFFIKALEGIITLTIVVVAVAILVVTIGAMFGGVPVGDFWIEGPTHAAIVAIGGTLGLLVVGGTLYLGLGKYNNTARTADALELLITLRR